MNNKNNTKLFSTQQQLVEAQKISFWDGDKDSGKWCSGVIQCSPVSEVVPYGDRSSKQKITRVIAKLRESSSYFVLEECRIKKNSAFVGSTNVGFCRANKKQEEWVKKVNTFKNDNHLRGNAKSQIF